MAEEDPLLDDGYRFVERLIHNGNDVQVKEYCHHSHGFLNFDIPGGVKATRIPVEHGIEYFFELFQKAQNSPESAAPEPGELSDQNSSS